jgi:DNA-binding NarL/FixJ family response regulator
MLSILLASREHDDLAGFAAGLWQNDQVVVTHVDSAAEALKSAAGDRIDVVVVGEELADMQPVELVADLVRIRPMINCAMVSALGHDEFHEVTEGLGVLMQLPPNPSEADAAVLLGRIAALSALSAKQAARGKEI